MNQIRFSTIAHRDHLFCSPLAADRANRLISLLDLPIEASVIDVGCGKVEILIRAAEMYPSITGLGVDPNAAFLEVGRAAAAQRGVSSRLTLREARIADVHLEPEMFDAAICIGSSQAFGTFKQAIAALEKLVRPRGHVLIGEPYWRIQPDPEYLSVLGARSDHHLTHASNEVAGLSDGLVPVYSCVSNADEWDHYEGLFCRSVENFVQDHQNDPDATKFRNRIRDWREAYLRWGRDTLGFGFYLFQKSPGSATAV